MNRKNRFFSMFSSSFRWVLFVSRRFAVVDRKSAVSVTSVLSSLGICFGVMTLITVISVMNGFQHSFIDAIMEVSSYHVRVAHLSDEKRPEFEQFCLSDPDIQSFTPFYEARSLVTGRSGRESAAVIKAVPPDICASDSGFSSQLRMVSGAFSVSEQNSIVLGSELARRLGVRTGGFVNLYALSGGADVDLFSSDRVFTVRGIFHTGYAEINAGYAFISLDDGKAYFGADAPLLYGIKLFNSGNDFRVHNRIAAAFPDAKCESWRSYNRSFFGALKVEKNMLMVIVFLIFVVVGVNIFNGMRRLVFERREEISILSAFGGKPDAVQSIFIMQGFLTGIKGAVPGLLLGLLLCVNMDTVFLVMSRISYYGSLVPALIFNPEGAQLIRENSMFVLYSHIPPRVYFWEVFAITLFGVCSSLFASWAASRSILKLSVAEVMRDE